MQMLEFWGKKETVLMKGPDLLSIAFSVTVRDNVLLVVVNG